MGYTRRRPTLRIAGFVCKLPALRERLDDVIPLAEYFLRQMSPHGEPPQLDDAVRTSLLRREYPGNVRDLRQVVSRLLSRYAGGGTITIGSVPSEERPAVWQEKAVWWVMSICLWQHDLASDAMRLCMRTHYDDLPSLSSI